MDQNDLFFWLPGLIDVILFQIHPANPTQINPNHPKFQTRKKKTEKEDIAKPLSSSLSLSLSLSLLSLHASTFVNLLAFSHGNHSLPSLSIPSLQPQTFISKDPSVLSPSQIKLSFSHQTYYLKPQKTPTSITKAIFTNTHKLVFLCPTRTSSSSSHYSTQL